MNRTQQFLRMIGSSGASLRVVISLAVLAAAAPDGAAKAPSAEQASERVTAAMTEEFMKGFRFLDADRDGEIDFTSLVKTLRSVGYGKVQSGRGGRGGSADPFERFEALDSDGDGILREDEAGPYLRGTVYFGDGEVTLDEYRKAWAELVARRGRRGRGAGGGRRPSGGSESGATGLQARDVEFLAALDANRDRRLTREELRAAIESAVTEEMNSRTGLDADGNGEISAREYALSQPETGRPVDENGLDGHARGHFEREDRDRDGVITVAEVSERVSENLARRYRAVQIAVRLNPADANGDGHLELAELEAVDADAIASVLGVSADSPLKLEDLYGRIFGVSLDRTAALDEVIPSTCAQC